MIVNAIGQSPMTFSFKDVFCDFLTRDFLIHVSVYHTGMKIQERRRPEPRISVYQETRRYVSNPGFPQRI